MALQERVLHHNWSGTSSARYLPLLAFGIATLEPPAKLRIQLYETGNTGGLLPFDTRLELSSTSVDNTLYDDDDIEATHTSAGQLDFIRSATRLSVTELARVFSVTRQTVHEWCQGAPLARHNAQKLDKFAAAVAVLLDTAGSVTVQDLRRSVRGGSSLLDTIRADGDVSTTARNLIETLTREAAQRRRLAARFANRQTPALVPGDFGRPHLKDED
jgi:DNA-binding transcriptional regulator YiaG